MKILRWCLLGLCMGFGSASARLLLATALSAGSLTAQAISPLEGRDISGNPVAANAASAVFEYDPNLNITWLRDWNVNGQKNWDTQVAWAAGLTYFGGSWRLPFIVDTGGIACDFSFSGTDCGYNVQTKTGSTVYSEMAYLWYVELGNLASCDTSGNCPQTGGGMTNTGPFSNMLSDYWSSTEVAQIPNLAWHFHPDGPPSPQSGGFFVSGGFQDTASKNDVLFAVAVRPGDVAAVPEPATVLLIGAGMLGLIVWMRRRAVW